MCGIVGYIGSQEASEYLIDGLRRLEYRGYDSAGVAAIDAGGRLRVTKATGRIDDLVARLKNAPIPGAVGIGHTRWATHGQPSDENAHPHYGARHVLAIVHNGVIENYQQLKQRLMGAGHQFESVTDTEVLAHLISDCLDKQEALPTNGRPPAEHVYDLLVDAVQDALSQVRGTYGLVVLFRNHPNVLIAARLGSPMVIGVGHDEHFLASDASPMVGRTDKIVYLADHELAVVTGDSLKVLHRDQGEVAHAVEPLEIDANEVSLGGFSHYMMKEIHEQPESLRNAMRGRLSADDATAVFGGLNLDPQRLRQVNRICLTACGTSLHAAMVGEYLIEELARIPVEVEYASELRYRNPPMDYKTLVFAITQSGETADTLAAMRECKRKGHAALAICNVVGSSIAQESDGGIFLHAGPEIGVASTKAFTAQCTVLAMLALYFGRLHHLSFEAGRRIIAELQKLPDYVEAALETDRVVRQVALKYQQCNNFLYLGRQYNFPTALEGALKLKEISYVHAEGYPAAEMKHGPIALVEENTPSVFLIPQGFVYEKVLANMEEIKARGGPVIAVVGDDDAHVTQLADDIIHVPAVPEFLQPIVMSVPLQLLAYHIAVLRGCDVDKPRNLAKSVTVE
ncbi:MAG: glutamine--fructose-6-phosphate transaminase (isomerizing) [Planctomycetales bacterium]|nr:glutamine--fructose-6-phosphate transaminase (isomerizing) [Planctomycetales bacterium]NIM09465.1 glutamine--fructose-6-phosphate transaminase (isomerizing) [Planctomycetales bacterium]NIN08953.1 glutamine--fructose-6-phosphate transaminase (isomerizing) [Planctomycetales bacterium]NIN78068.1 glutamine--fructose-6-phosphate transaminase (isomerizing) [Planctomycetales bacterium]NIO35246.1 glutamine--fructose-6-phosphate transaminase (isomerizing) [Planctomycetales bacterium]